MPEEKRVALVVGNGAYDNTPRLPNPVKDAKAMASALQRLDFEVLDAYDLAYPAFAGRVRDFGRALREAHVALFYYAGHGLQVDGANYVVPVDAALEHEADVQLELVAVQTILAQMEIGNRTSVVILDSCRNNPLARNLARAMGTRSVAVGRGLGRIESGIGSYIAFATAPDQVASDGAMSAGNSPYTKALLNHIETPDVTISEIMMRVRQEVIEATRTLPDGPQIPWESSSLVAPFYFKRLAGPQTGAPRPDPAVITDRAERDWERFRVADTEDMVVLQAYIDQYERSEPLWALRARQRLDVVNALIAERGEKARKEAERAEAEARGRQEEEDPKAGIVRVLVGTGGGKDQERRIKPGAGEGFKDFEHGPEMVVVPASQFNMGSTDEEIAAVMKEYGDYFKSEGPQHRVTIPAPFAIGRYAVTRGEFLAFVSATGHRTEGGAHVWTGNEWKLDPSKSWRDPGFAQDDSHPVVCVNWDNAQAYIAWLRKTTGKEYRLPSEAEWEYCCRAGTPTPFWQGGSISTDQANYNGNYTYGGGEKSEWRQKTLPVKSFDPNPWGLYQVHGNVWEWCEDKWHDSYADKPEGLKADGGAWTTGRSGARVLRGGSWNSNPAWLRSTVSIKNTPVNRSFDNGFRVARTLTS